MSPELCPNCGAEVPRNAKACPACGSDDATGWSEEAHLNSLGLPDEEFDYNEFTEREFGTKKKVRPYGVRRLWWTVALAIVILFFWAVFGRLF